MNKKTPLRMCMGCNEMKPKKELIRIVKTNNEQIEIDLTGKKSGRGAYICKNEECLAKLKKYNKIKKTFDINIEEEFYNMLKEEINNIGDK